MVRILVADDEAPTRELLRELLGHEGYDVITAKDGIDAVLLARSSSPDLLILDIMMPNFNGYDVCRKMRQEPGLKTTPIILLTSREQEIDSRLLKLMGVGYLNKMCKPGDLLAMIRDLLKG